MDSHGRRGERFITSRWPRLLVNAWLAHRAVLALRTRAYDHHLLPVHRLPVPVVSVGNLTVGGTGKSPVVALVTDLLRRHGHLPVVLSRGYRGDGASNDEAQAMTCPVICDPDRIAGGRRALADGATCLVLDDGFQHRRLYRDLDLVCIDCLRPWGADGAGRGHILPLGLMREPIAALNRADAVILTRCDVAPPRRVARLADTCARRFALPVLHAAHHPRCLRSLTDDSELPPQALRGRPVILASGLGNPAGFEASCRKLGYRIVAHERFPDHHRYRHEDVALIAARARTAQAQVVVTSKDAVKLSAMITALAEVVCHVLEVDVRLSATDQHRLAHFLATRIPSPRLP